ncbi:hypothetical protein IPG41_05750 [Candidatus Peregrinibacteria bacterium]|nr:MAG: hypothetical protein IPG41_05750 [Candidatus Peregrinibacteria bacterium]
MKTPKTLRFPGQKNNEKIQLLVRKHWIIDVKISAIFLIIGILPLLLGIWFGEILWASTHGTVFWTYLLVFLVYALFILLFVYLRWLNEELDIVIVTNERIISHNQIDLFHRQISEALVEDIQDIKGIEQGLLGHLLHFGAMEITTSSNQQFFAIKNIEDPHGNTRAMLDVRDQCAIHS